MALEIVKYDDLIPRMARDLRGIQSEKFDVGIALRDAGRRFLQESEAWFEKLTAIDLVADQQEYTLSSGGWLAQFKRIKSLHLRTETEVTDGDEGSIVDPMCYRLNLPSTLKFVTGRIPAVSVTGGMVVTVVFVPQMDAKELPEWIVSRWGDAIIGYALYTLIRGTDIQKAMAFLNQYHRVLNEAMVESMDEIHPGQPEGDRHGILIKENFTP